MAEKLSEEPVPEVSGDCVEAKLVDYTQRELDETVDIGNPSERKPESVQKAVTQIIDHSEREYFDIGHI